MIGTGDLGGGGVLLRGLYLPLQPSRWITHAGRSGGHTTTFFITRNQHHSSMTQRQKTTVLTVLGAADLTCFALGNVHYGETWSWIGVLGLLLFLALFEFL